MSDRSTGTVRWVRTGVATLPWLLVPTAAWPASGAASAFGILFLIACTMVIIGYYSVLEQEREISRAPQSWLASVRHSVTTLFPLTSRHRRDKVIRLVFLLGVVGLVSIALIRVVRILWS